MAKTYKLFSWNVNGIRAVHRKEHLLPFFKSHKPDILGLQETKANKEQLGEDIVNIDNYEVTFHSAERKGYSGVATYSKIKPKSVETKIGIDKFDNEGRIIISKYEHFTLLNVYFPNGGSGNPPSRLDYKMEFYDEFLKYINKLRKKGEKVVFCGDVNTSHREIDLARPKANKKKTGFLPVERAWIDKVVEQDYIDTLRQVKGDEPDLYSWWSMRSNARERNVGWRLDYFFISKELLPNLVDAAIHTEVFGSDHCPVSLTLKF